MCESKVVVVEDGREEVLVEEAAGLLVASDGLIVWDIEGREYRVGGFRELRVDFLKHVVRVVKE